MSEEFAHNHFLFFYFFSADVTSEFWNVGVFFMLITAICFMQFIFSLLQFVLCLLYYFVLVFVFLIDMPIRELLMLVVSLKMHQHYTDPTRRPAPRPMPTPGISVFHLPDFWEFNSWGYFHRVDLLFNNNNIVCKLTK